MNEQSRNRAIDVAKAIGIILVVIGHIPRLYGPLWSAIYSFHMPLFFIMAGAVYAQREPIQVFVRGAKKLLVPYVIVIGICVLMAFLFGNYGRVHSYALGLLFPDGNRGDYNILASWPSVEAMWFFPAMFCCRWLYSIIAKYVNNNMVAVCAIIQLVSVIIGRCFINLPFGLLAGTSVLFFFALGSKVIDFAGGRIRDKWIPILVFLNLWLLSIWKGSFSVMYFNYNLVSYMVDAFVAVGATWLVYRIAKYLENSKLLNIIGKETLLILCCHEIVRQLIEDLTFIDIRFGIYRGAVALVAGTLVLSAIAIYTKAIIVKFKQTK